MTVCKLPDYLFDKKTITNTYIYNIDVVSGSSLFFKSLGNFLRIIGEDLIEFKIDKQNLESITKSPLFISEPTLSFTIKSGFPDDIFKKISYKYGLSESEKKSKGVSIIAGDKVIVEMPQLDTNTINSDHAFYSIFSMHNQIEIHGSRKDWSFYFDREYTEWLIVGLSAEIIRHFEASYILNANCEKYRYKAFNHALDNNVGLAWAHEKDKKFIKELKKNYLDSFI